MNLERGSVEDCLAVLIVGDVVDVAFLEDLGKKSQFSGTMMKTLSSARGGGWTMMR
jgi:hypothetical protein